MQHWELLLTNARIATMQPDDGLYGTIEDAALAIADGTIAWLGPMASLPVGHGAPMRSLDGRWLTPALIDSHTHLVFAGHRAREFEMRKNGASYEDIARAGGGIMSTVSATRAASTAELEGQTGARIERLRREGCATIEIKSGYGLDVASEIRMLEIARNLGAETGLSVVTSFLGAHACPPDYRGAKDRYIDVVCTEMLPAVAAGNLADAVDAYCESIAFSLAQVGRVFDTARSLGLPVKLHADQLSDCGGAALAARFGALSADHLEYVSPAGIEALAGAGSVAVMLPGAFLTLGETRKPPIAALREAGVPLAVATDCNPGTSPLVSLRTAMTLATDLFDMTPAECLAGVTRNAARALGLDDRGILAVGKRADLAIWDIGHPQELSYWIGTNELAELMVAGRTVGQ